MLHTRSPYNLRLTVSYVCRYSTGRIAREGGRLEKIGPDYRIHKNGSLIIKEANKIHDAQYNCMVSNPWGNATSKKVTLTVEGKQV